MGLESNDSGHRNIRIMFWFFIQFQNIKVRCAALRFLQFTHRDHVFSEKQKHWQVKTHNSYWFVFAIKIMNFIWNQCLSLNFINFHYKTTQNQYKRSKNIHICWVFRVFQGLQTPKCYILLGFLLFFEVLHILNCKLMMGN